jgi:hypothetical protein
MKAKRKKTPGPVQTITINARKVSKDKKVMQLINEYASEFCEGMEPKIALSYFLKEQMPGKIAELRENKKARAMAGR